ncbi:TPA: hypothetical protein N0F65_010004 [Lagenidium giganteum]|uniref:MARVEL domain-containing protein n=1 Tax=Lagenidium giganteum TaxID=4803 RepID=A0AAV2ZAG7_9STRA|nr:TPA: hypothetical protein N0F65_010004 [Lagenidium giganteum]
MVDPRVPLWVRSGTLLAAFIAFATGSAGYIRSCQFGSDVYGSKNQVNFMIAMGVLSFIVLAIRIIVCDVRQCVRGNRKVFLAIEIVFAFLTFVAGIAGSAAPVSSAVCSDAENKEFMEEVCEFKCSNILAAIVSNFFMCMGFLISLLFTYNPALITTTAEEDFTFGETPPTPRTHKINNANSTNV